MPHVSRRKVKKKIYLRLETDLLDVFLSSRSKKEMAGLIKDLLTSTERVMLAKRIAIILMLNEGYSFRAVERTLKVTLQTVFRFWKMKKDGKFKDLKRKNKQDEGFWEMLEKIMQAGLPPRGKGRWKHVFETMDNAEKRYRRLYKN